MSVEALQRMTRTMSESLAVAKNAARAAAEREWLTSQNPQKMLRMLAAWDGPLSSPSRGEIGISERKVRLFACACVRRAWDLLVDPRSRRAVEVAERLADEGALTTDSAGRQEASSAAMMAQMDQTTVLEANAADAAWALVGTASAVECALQVIRVFQRNTLEIANPHAALLREVVGSPFASKWLQIDGALYVVEGDAWVPAAANWITPDAIDMAHAIYDEGDFSAAAMNVLADCLEEAGCIDADLLEHLRGQRRSRPADDNPRGWEWWPLDGPHVRGCWVIDCLTGRT